MKTFSVRPDWKRRGVRLRAHDWRCALRLAIEHWPSDLFLYRYDYPGVGFERHPWGVRLERGQRCVDIVEVRRIGGGR